MEKTQNRVDTFIEKIIGDLRRAEVSKDQQQVRKQGRNLNRALKLLTSTHHSYFNNIANEKSNHADINPNFLMSKIQKLSNIIHKKKESFAKDQTLLKQTNAQSMASVKKQSRISDHIDWLIEGFKKAKATQKKQNIALHFNRLNRGYKLLAEAYIDNFDDLINGKKHEITHKPEFLMAKMHRLSDIMLKNTFHFTTKAAPQNNSTKPKQSVDNDPKQPQP